MDTHERARLYLRDQAVDGVEPRFSDEDLEELITLETSIEGAVALGWLLVAAELADATVSESIGNSSESFGQPTERYKVAMAMHHYWLSRAEVVAGSTMKAGLWWELVPDYAEGTEGIVSELIEHKKFILENYAA